VAARAAGPGAPKGPLRARLSAVLLALPFGLAIGISLGALGGGGAVLALPVLVYVLGEDVHAAATASLAVVAAAALAGGAAQASRARVCWPQALLFAPAALAGAVGGTFASRSVADAVLLVGFVPVLLAAAAFTWRRAGAGPDEDRACPPLDGRLTLLGGLAVGFLTGFFGVGGGFLVVPMLALAMRFPLRRAIGTSLVIVGFVSLAALAAHLWHGAGFDAGVAAVMAGGCAAGAVAGTRLAERLPQRTVGRSFALLLIAVAAFMLAAAVLVGA
jgi:uncharacterized membrane protein YfcA